ncbi:MAG: glucose-6-phosphate isomerase [Pseudomonadota bacterium]
MNPRQSKAWAALEKQAAKRSRIDSIFESDPQRAERCTIENGGIRLDYSKTAITTDVLQSLIRLANDAGVAERMNAMLCGQHINTTEDRAVLHIALRDIDGALAGKYGTDKHKAVLEQLSRMQRLSDDIRSGEWQGFSGKRIRHVVNIGIGGSDLGPKMVCEALRHLQSSEIQVHFASTIDETHLPNILHELDPEETLFSISSKTFTTQETMYNARNARQWVLDHFSDVDAIASHFIAVSSNTQAAVEFGIAEQNLLSFWEWVGGRYSLWSTIGFPICAAVGFARFEELLRGAHALDAHFFTAEFDNNIPLILALCGIWHNNFCAHHSLGVIPYNDALGLLPMYLQQLDMESNGKSVDLDGNEVNYATGPLVWGQSGSNGQHAFFQLLHQGTNVIPLEFVFAVNAEIGSQEQHRALLGNMLAQSNALMRGENADVDKRHLFYSGDKPSISLALDQLTPARLGALIALFEHKVFVQGAIWNINSFDQWGVQLGKRLATQIGTDFSRPNTDMDSSTQATIAWIHERMS